VNFWKVILATIVIYGAGVMSGGLLVNRVDHSRFRPQHRPDFPALSVNSNTAISGQSPMVPRSPRPPDFMSRPFLQQLDEELHLKPDQHEAIQKIIDEGQNLMRKTTTDTRLEIRDVLTQAQRDKFDDLVKRPPLRRPPNFTNAPVADFEKFQRNAMEHFRGMSNPPPFWQPGRPPANSTTNAPGN
jgi:hypothetical protein